MPRRAKSRHLAAWMNGEKLGNWSMDARGRHEFRYEQAWVDAADARPLSLSMPVRPPTAPYRGAIVESFFENLLPDSAEIRRRAQIKFGAESTSAFDLLIEIGRDCAGAIRCAGAGYGHDHTEERRDGDGDLLDPPRTSEGVARSLMQMADHDQRPGADPGSTKRMIGKIRPGMSIARDGGRPTPTSPSRA